MNKPLTAWGLATAGIFALHANSTAAQEYWQPDYSHEVQIYGGEHFGDRLTETPISGSTPRLNDSATVGGRYNFNYNRYLGVQLQVGYNPARFDHANGGGGSVNIVDCDLDAVWNIFPDLSFHGYRISPYAVVGAGYAWALGLDRPINGSVGGTPVTLDASNGYTANAGVGAKYFITDNLFVDFSGRYRYYSRLVTNYGQGLNGAESTLGVGWKF